MLHDVTDGIAEGAQPKRLNNDEGMHRDRKDKRVFARLFEHLVELVDDHLGKLPPGMAPENKRRRVVDLERVGHRKDWSGTSTHPDRLIVHRPVHDIAIAGLFQQVERHCTLGDVGTQPTLWPPAREACEDFSAFADQPCLVLLPEIILALRISSAMT